MFGADMLSGMFGSFDMSNLSGLIDQGKAFLPILKNMMDSKCEPNEQMVYMLSIKEENGQLIPVAREVVLKNIEGTNHIGIKKIIAEHNLLDMLKVIQQDNLNNG